MPYTQKIGIVGLGTIATALVEGIAGDGHTITVSTRSHTNATRLAQQFESITVAENQQVLDASNVVIIGLTTDSAPAALEALRFSTAHQVISLMADFSFTTVASLVAPATMTVRMIPFPSISTGGSPILTFGNSDLIEALFGARNAIFTMQTESELASYLCAQAVLSPAVSMVKEAADWLQEQGASDPVEAERFVRTLVGESLLASGCADLLRALDTPGGYNQRLRQYMIKAGLHEKLRAGLGILGH